MSQTFIPLQVTTHCLPQAHQQITVGISTLLQENMQIKNHGEIFDVRNLFGKEANSDHLSIIEDGVILVIYKMRSDLTMEPEGLPVILLKTCKNTFANPQ